MTEKQIEELLTLLRNISRVKFYFGWWQFIIPLKALQGGLYV
jgi:hypothetical protein